MPSAVLAPYIFIIINLSSHILAMIEKPSIAITSQNAGSLEPAEDRINPEITHARGAAHCMVKDSNSSGTEHKGEKL